MFSCSLASCGPCIDPDRVEKFFYFKKSKLSDVWRGPNYEYMDPSRLFRQRQTTISESYYIDSPLVFLLYPTEACASLLQYQIPNRKLFDYLNQIINNKSLTPKNRPTHRSTQPTNRERQDEPHGRRLSKHPRVVRHDDLEENGHDCPIMCPMR